MERVNAEGRRPAADEIRRFFCPECGIVERVSRFVVNPMHRHDPYRLTVLVVLDWTETSTTVAHVAAAHGKPPEYPDGIEAAETDGKLANSIWGTSDPITPPQDPGAGSEPARSKPTWLDCPH